MLIPCPNPDATQCEYQTSQYKQERCPLVAGKSGFCEAHGRRYCRNQKDDGSVCGNQAVADCLCKPTAPYPFCGYPYCADCGRCTREHAD